jgi:uncharacterized membrane protein
MSTPTAPRAWTAARAFVLLSGVGMVVFAALTVAHYFDARYPGSIAAGSACDLNAFFNCSGLAYSRLASLAGVPIGWLGMALGALVALTALRPSEPLGRTARPLAALNVALVVVLLLFSLLVLRAVCLLCLGYHATSFVALGALWAWGRRSAQPEGGAATSARATAAPLARRWSRPDLALLALFGVFAALGAWGVGEYHGVRREAQVGGVASRVVGQFYSLPRVPWPSEISRFWTVRSTDDFEGAPVRIVEFGDPLCIDCRLLHEQIRRLALEFEGQINVAYQFFPLDASCNDVVDKDKHPGACELSAMVAGRPDDVPAMLDEIYENMQAAETPEWRAGFAERWDVGWCAADTAITREVQRLIRTGAEYEKTSLQHPYGIRSTPTMIVNNRMVIGTLPYEQLRAIVQALVDEHERGGAGFMEAWEDTGG